MSFKLKTAPDVEPITLDDAKEHLRVDESDEDALIAALVKAAREHVESFTSQPLITQAWTYYGNCFSREVDLKPNLQNISSVKYIDNNGAQQTINPAYYEADTTAIVGVLYPAYEYVWPSTRNIKNSVEVEFVAGFGDASAVPEAIKQAIKLLIGHWYVNREAVSMGQSNEIPVGVDLLLRPFRVINF